MEGGGGTEEEGGMSNHSLKGEVFPKEKRNSFQFHKKSLIFY